jgi:hypothetical protein
MGGSRLAQRQIKRQRRLPPVAHPDCWAALNVCTLDQVKR